MNLIFGILLVIGLILLFFITWVMNNRMEVPIDEIEMSQKCSSCNNSSCGVKYKMKRDDN